MSGKIKKSSENMSFSLSRWFRKLSTNAPALTVITIVGISYAIFPLRRWLIHPNREAYSIILRWKQILLPRIQD